jgi:hypothetical protein
MVCPINDDLTPSKRNCSGCSYFDYTDDGDNRYSYICTYKEPCDGDFVDEGLNGFPQEHI